MKHIWHITQGLIAAAGGWIGAFLGGADGLLYTLVAFAVIDYITGVLCAVADRRLSSAVGFRGICRKVLIFLMVGVAHTLDAHVIGAGAVLRTAVIFFYLSNEGISLLENAAHLGLPIPQRLKMVLEQLHERADASASADSPAHTPQEDIAAHAAAADAQRVTEQDRKEEKAAAKKGEKESKDDDQRD